MKLNIKKFVSSKKTAIIAGIVLFSLIVPNLVWAINLPNPFPELQLLKGGLKLFTKMPEATAMAFGEAILMTFSNFIFDLLSLLVKLGGLMFNAMLKIGFQSHLEIVKAGWGVTRDFANMLFILFMVIIAFATILRTEKYGIKQLLPKVIIIALLINFSLVICSVIIDFSNITANFFINETTKSIHGKGGISGSLATSLNMAEIYQPIDCDKFSDDPEEDGKTAKQKCLEDAAGKFGANIITFMISITWGSLVMLITAFVFFAGAIILLIRVVMIWFLVVLVPFVFLCYIMPGLRKIWQDWWKNFLKWCFFAPAYTFFVWLAVKVAAEGKTFEVAKKMSTEFTGMGAIANAFTSSPALIIHYLFIIALLLGGLIAASKFGITGAGAAMKIVQKAKQGTGNWAKRTGMRPVKAVGTKVGAGAMAVGGKLFGGRLGRRMKARATQLRQAAEERPEHKKYEALLKGMSPHDRLEEMEIPGIRGFMAAKKVASDPTLVRTMSTQKAGLAIDKLRKFGEHQAADKLEETRADAIKNKTEQEKVVQKVTQEGNLNKIPAIVLKDERFVAAINKFASAPQIESLRKVSPQHGDELKDTLDRITTSLNYTTMKNKGIDPHIDKIQHAYASQTGDVKRFVTTKQKIDWAKKAGPEGLKRMTTFDKDIAINIPVAQLKNTLEKMENTMVVKDTVHYLKNTTTAAAYNLANNDPYINNLG